jgi:hypothetical protein
MRLRITVAIAAVAGTICLAGCATNYQSDGITGGYSERRISGDVWAVGFAGNGYTTYETVQTYWLYRAAELTVQKGYDGFEIVGPLKLSQESGSVRFVPVQIYTETEAKPVIVSAIRLMRRPFPDGPRRVFDAKTLKATLQPHISSLCGSNVCPHVHDYLLPDLTPRPLKKGDI